VDIVVVAGQAVLTDVAIEYDQHSNDLDPADLVYRPSPHGLRTVEEAIRIRDGSGPGTVTVVSFGTGGISAAIGHYLAMGADSGIYIGDKTLREFDAYALSSCLSEAIRGRPYDLVLCEGLTMDPRGGSIYLGPYLGEMLTLPHVSGVTSLRLADDGRYVEAHRKLPRGDREIVRCPLPCLIAVETEINEPRYPSLAARLEAVHKPASSVDLPGSAADGCTVRRHDSLVQLTRVSPPRGRVKKGLAIDTKLSAAERIKLTIAGGAAPKSTKQTLLTGDPVKLAERIIAVALGQGVVKQLQDKDGND
jgi:electron transfer flavoprotein beta subunit